MACRIFWLILFSLSFHVCVDRTFVVGKALAYGTLCRLVCRRTEAAPGSWLLGHFYRLLRDGLLAWTDMRCAYAILLNSSLLFALALDGASVLIPHYLAAVRHIVRFPAEDGVTVLSTSNLPPLQFVSFRS
jgi:hypothetical protein